MAYNYNFTETAERQLDEIISYISETLLNLKAAKELYNKIFLQIDNIINFPKMGTLLDNPFIKDKYIRWVSVDDYLIYYKINEVSEIITIICITYAKRNIPNLLNK